MGEMSKNWPSGEQFNALRQNQTDRLQGSEPRKESGQTKQEAQGDWQARSNDQDKTNADNLSVGKQAASVATKVADQAKEIANNQLAKRAEKSAGVIGEVAEALRNLDIEDSAGASYVSMAADQLEKVSEFVRTADPKDMVRKAEGFARKEPLLFLGGAFTLGLLTARFLKSSSHREEGAT